MSFQVFGLPVSRGIAIGRAVLVASSRVDVAHYFVAEARRRGRDRRLRGARDAVAAELTALQRDLPTEAPAELSALLDVHLMLLHDEALTGATKQWIRERHYNAEWALSAQLEVLARQFDEMEDEYLRERKADLEQVVERLLRRRWRAAPTALRRWRPRGRAASCAARIRWCWSPTTSRRPTCCSSSAASSLGFVTDVGGKTSHTAIVARSMDIPAVVGAREASRLIRQDDWVVIDGDAGVVIVDPSPRVLEEYRFRQRQRDLEPRAPGAAAPHAGRDARRRARRAARQHRAARRRRGRARGRRGRHRPVPQRVPVHEPRRRAARRGRAVRGLPRPRSRR